MADNDALMAEVQAALGGGDNAALLAQLGSALQSSKPAKEAGADPSPPKRIKPEPGTQRAYAPIAPRPAPAAPRPPPAPPAARRGGEAPRADRRRAREPPARIDSGTPGMRLGPELKRAPAYGVEYEWKPETPTPEASGGHYTVDARGRGRKTQSRVGRLAGTVVLEVEATPRFADAFLGHGSAVWSNAGRFVEPLRDGTSDAAEPRFRVAPFEALRVGARLPARAAAVVEAVEGLNDRDNDFKDRCCYGLAFVRDEAVRRVAAAAGPPVTVEVHVPVYLRRAIFGLSAHPSVMTLFDALIPAGAVVATRKPPPDSAAFKRSPKPGEDGEAFDGKFDFSIPGLLRAAESTGVALPPGFKAKGLAVELRDYQLEGLKWMRDQESRDAAVGGVPGLNGYFWEKRSFADGGDSFYYFPLAGHVLLEAPPVVTGGLLADEMGLGKTVTTLALVASDLADDPRDLSAAGLVARVKGAETIYRGGTLVVVPVSLYVQWQEEIKAKAPGLSCFAFDPARELAAGARRVKAADLARYDVVVVKMPEIQKIAARTAGRNTALTKLVWRRVIVDEAQYVRNDTAQIAQAVHVLEHDHTWMLSGTPLTNRLDDLQGILSLLRVWPFTLGAGSDAGWQNHFWAGPRRDEAVAFGRFDVRLGAAVTGQRMAASSVAGFSADKLDALAGRAFRAAGGGDVVLEARRRPRRSSRSARRPRRLGGLPAPPPRSADERRDDAAYYPNAPPALLDHYRAAAAAPSAKLSALVAEVKRLKASNVETQCVVLSEFGSTLDALEPLLEDVAYDVAIVNDRKNLLVGTKVVEPVAGVVVKAATYQQRWIEARKAAEDADEEPPKQPPQWKQKVRVYDIRPDGEALEDGDDDAVLEEVDRDEIVAKVYRTTVASRSIRGRGGDDCLTRCGADNRFAVGDEVQCKKPPARADEPLEVGMRVEVKATGVQGHVHEVKAGGAYVVKHGTPERWENATVEALRGAPGDDPFAGALGFVRLDGGTDANRRGELLQEFKSDPLTSVCLLTVRSAGVGLNLTNANVLCLCEPALDAAPEEQAVMRVHRIGQTRPVTVLKFFAAGTVDARVLARRERRGEKSEGAAMAAVAADTDGVDGNKVMQFGDIEYLLGVKG
ncbi:hypothetical protein JL720_1591 [Aureococcus anophagefferens]|nr:hypothetical protein JL720_1591 [Aureococcus anophagefferens]